LHELTDADSREVFDSLSAILQLADHMAREGHIKAHEIYVRARNARDIMTFDQASRDTLKKILGEEMWQGYRVSEAVLAFMKAEQKIHAIKQFRGESNLDLYHAKVWVESYMVAHNLKRG
jgi:ribosomal protein L7/L12